MIPNASVNTPLKQFLCQKFHCSFDTKPARNQLSRYATILLVLLCTFLLGLEYREYKADPNRPLAPKAPSTHVQEMLLFDYPSVAALANTLLQEYGPESLDPVSKLNEEGKALRRLFLTTPYWGGFYTEAVVRVSQRDFIPTPSISPSLLGERIRAGEIWRLVTPAFLHVNLLHLLINMTWLIALGSQIERKIPLFRYLLLIVLFAVVSNSAQYLMSGANFVGFSGVICGMVGFIAARQRTAPWEGYIFSQWLYSSVLFFIWALVAMSVVFFCIETYLHISVPIGLANTAHLSGLATGLLAGNMQWFRMTRYANEL